MTQSMSATYATTISRRALLRRVVAAGAAFAAAPFVSTGRVRLSAQATVSYSTRAVDLVHEALVVDMLHQIVYRIDQRDVLQRWLYKPDGFTQAEFDVYRQGGFNAISFGNASPDFEAGVRLLAEFNSFIAAYPDRLLRISHASDLERAKQSGRLGILFGFQNSTHFRTPDDVDTFYGLGQRSSQLTYNPANLLADGAFEPRNGGITEFGARILTRMNEVGMAVDVAHTGDQTQLDAYRLSNAPVIISHGNARALNDGHLRCMTDESIRGMAKTGGVMGVNFISFMVKRREPTTVDDVVDHVDYIAKLVGIEHVGMGSDLGLESNDHADREQFQRFMKAADARYRIHAREVVEGLDHPKRVYVLTEALIKRGYTDSQIKLVLGGNWRRVLGTIWK